MSFGGVPSDVSHPLRRANSLESFLTGERPLVEEALEVALRDITLRTRRVLANQDWSGERIPAPIQRRMADNLRGIGVNLERRYSFSSDDSLLEDNMVSPAEMRRAVEEEIDRMRREYEQNQQGAEGHGAGDQAGQNGLPARPIRRREELQALYDSLVQRHNSILDHFLQTLEAGENAALVARNAGIARQQAETARRVAEVERDEAVAARREAEAALTRNQDRNRRRTNFGENEYNIDVTLKIIKEFDGNDSTKLEGFLKNCKLVFSRVHERDHPEVLQLILTNKLTDRAMRDMRYKDIETMEQLETELESLYGTKKSIAALHAELSSLRQKEGEAVNTYGSRAERIAAELVEQLTKGVATRVEQRAMEEAMRQCTKAAFEAGLHGQLQTLVRAKDFKTLHESVTGAIDIARTINAGVRSTRPERNGGCFKCGEVGHIAKDCPKRQQTTLPKAVKRVNAILVAEESDKDSGQHGEYEKLGHTARSCSKKQGSAMADTIRSMNSLSTVERADMVPSGAWQIQ